MTARLEVMNLERGHRATQLTSPVVPLENLLAELSVEHWIELQAWSLLSGAVQLALGEESLCGARAGGLDLSRLAPARKSAQTISRQ
jgi:hypothetical protein